MTRTAFGALAALVLVKGYLVFGYGPLFAADTTFLEDYADVLLTSEDWHRTIDLSSPEGVHLAERMIGYPAIIAGAKLLFGGAWASAVVALQSLLSLLATVLLYRALVRLTRSARWALFGAFCYATSLPLIWDTFIFYDSVVGGLMTILASAVTLAMLREGPILPGEALALGLLGAVAFLVRDLTLVLLLLFAPCLVYAAWRRNHRRWIGIAAAIGLFLAPALIVQASYNAWNEARSGQTFVTSAARTALFVPLLRMAAMGDDVFSGDTDLERAARREIERPDFSKVLESRYAVVGPILKINDTLRTEFGADIVQISKMIERFYIETVISHPLEMFRYAIAQIRPSLVRIFCQPVYGVTFFYEVRTEPLGGDIGRLTRFHFLMDKGVADASIWPFLLLGAEALARVTAIAIGLSMILVLPVWSLIALIRRTGRFAEFHVPILLAIVFAGIVCLYALIHIEPRYLLAVLGAGMLSAIPVLAKTIGALARRVTGQPIGLEGGRGG